MGKLNKLTLKIETYYFYNDQINLKDFDASLLKIDKKITTKLTFITLVMRLLKEMLIVIILTV